MLWCNIDVVKTFLTGGIQIRGEVGSTNDAMAGLNALIREHGRTFFRIEIAPSLRSLQRRAKGHRCERCDANSVRWNP